MIIYTNMRNITTFLILQGQFVVFIKKLIAAPELHASITRISVGQETLRADVGVAWIRPVRGVSGDHLTLRNKRRACYRQLLCHGNGWDCLRKCRSPRETTNDSPLGAHTLGNYKTVFKLVTKEQKKLTPVMKEDPSRHQTGQEPFYNSPLTKTPI